MSTDIFDDINAIISDGGGAQNNPDDTSYEITRFPSDDIEVQTDPSDIVMKKISMKLEELTLPQPKPIPKAAAPERKYDKYWTDTNILNPQILEEFRIERVTMENETFTEPLPTTFTIEGNYSNVKFLEEELIKHVEPCADIVIYDCNYGKKIYPGYTIPQKSKKSNRGRRPVEKPKKPRKKQGNGSAMSSQLTFVTRSRALSASTVPAVPAEQDAAQDTMQDTMQDTFIPAGVIIPSDTRVYKFKIFRNGKIQLPGAKPQIIDDIISCARVIEDKLNDIFPEKVISLTHLNAVMKNYKFCLKLSPGQIINFALLYNLVNADIKKAREYAMSMPVAHKSTNANTLTQNDNLIAPDLLTPGQDQIIALVPPKISHIKYTRMSVKFSIIFDTPRECCPDKKLRVKIWQSGKFNILGGLEVKYTREVCEYLRTLFLMHPELIVTPPTRKIVRTRVKYMPRMPNVAAIADADFVNMTMPTTAQKAIAIATSGLDKAFSAALERASIDQI